jgi:hypothetical protein
MSFPGSEVPIAANSPAEVSPPAPNWMPSSGFAIRLCEWTVSIRRSQSLAGKERKPEDSSITSKLYPSITDVSMLYIGELWEGGVEPEIFAFEKILFEHGFGVGVCEEVFGPSALFESR